MIKFKMNEWTRKSGLTNRIVDDITLLILKSIDDLAPFTSNVDKVVKKIESLNICIVTHNNSYIKDEILGQIYDNLLIDGHKDLIDIIIKYPHIIKFMEESYHAEELLLLNMNDSRNSITGQKHKNIYNDMGLHRPLMADLFNKASTLASYGIIHISSMGLSGRYFSFQFTMSIMNDLVNEFLRTNGYKDNVSWVVEAPTYTNFEVVNDIFDFLLSGFTYSNELPDTNDESYGRDYISVISFPEKNKSKKLTPFDNVNYPESLSSGSYIIRGSNRHSAGTYKVSFESGNTREYAFVDMYSDVFCIRNVSLRKKLKEDVVDDVTDVWECFTNY